MSATDVEPRPRSTGTGGRRTRSARSSKRSRRRGPRDRATGRQPARLRPRRAPLPAELLAQRPPPDEQQRHRLLSRYRAHGLLGTGGQAELWFGTTRRATERAVRRTELIESGALIEVTVEGLRGPRHVPSDALTTLDTAEAEVRDGVPPGRAESGVAFLAALDPFVWDRAAARPVRVRLCLGGLRAAGSGAGATTCCRSCSATGSSAGSSRGSSAARACSGSSGCGSRTASTPCRAGVRSGLRRRPPRTRRIRRRRADRAAPDCTTPPRGRGGVEAARARWRDQRLTGVRGRR